MSARSSAAGSVRLGESAERALSLAAVIGRDFDLELLARTVTSSEEALIDMLDAASRGRARARGEGHPGQLPLRARAHPAHPVPGPRSDPARTGAPPGGRGARGALRGPARPRVGELARHWTNTATPEGLVKAIEYSRQAGDAALDALAPIGRALAYYPGARSRRRGGTQRPRARNRPRDRPRHRPASGRTAGIP